MNIGAPIELLQISRYATHSLAELVEVERILLANALDQSPHCHCLPAGADSRRTASEGWGCEETKAEPRSTDVRARHAQRATHGTQHERARSSSQHDGPGGV